MDEAQFVIYLMSKDSTLLLADAQAEAAKVYGSQPKATGPQLTPIQQQAIRVDENWDNKIVEAEEESQNAVYPGQLRRIRRLTQEKLRARKFFDRAKMFM